MYCHIHRCQLHHCQCGSNNNSKGQGGAFDETKFVELTQEFKEELKKYTVLLKDEIINHSAGIDYDRLNEKISDLELRDLKIIGDLNDRINTTVELSDLKHEQQDTEIQAAKDMVNALPFEEGVLADTFVTVNTNGEGSVERSQHDKNRDFISVKDFGAKGDGVTDDTQAFKDAIAYVVTQITNNEFKGGSVRVPTGVYKVSDKIVVPHRVSIIGENRESSVVVGNSKTHDGFELAGNSSSVERLYIRGMARGVVAETARHSAVDNCMIAYNRIGIEWGDSYINAITNNKIVFNSYGVVVKDQSFQLNILNNVIDNNLGGCGILFIRGDKASSPGAVVQNNTIEGNRRIGTGHGIGIAVFGTAQRLTISQNWLERNGEVRRVVPGQGDGKTFLDEENPYSVDIMLGGGSTGIFAEMIEHCIPDEFKTRALSFPTNSTAGNIQITNNFHYLAKHAVLAQINFSSLRLDISGLTYIGQEKTGPDSVNYIYPEVIKLDYVGGSSKIIDVNIRDNFLLSATAGKSTDLAFMQTGIKSSYVHCTNTSSFNAIKLDGKDLFTAYVTSREFLQFPNATFNISFVPPSSGSATFSGEIRAELGKSGVTTESKTDNGRLSLRAGGLGASILSTTSPTDNNVVVVSTPGSYLYYGANPSGVLGIGTAEIIGDAVAYNILNNINARISSATFTGGFYGFCRYSDSETPLKLFKAARVVITDLNLVRGDTYLSTNPANESNLYGVKNQRVFNNNPSNYRAIGWVCVQEGAPAEWLPISNLTTASGLRTEGTTSQRPSTASAPIGFQYFDMTIGKPIYRSTSGWVDSQGEPV